MIKVGCLMVVWNITVSHFKAKLEHFSRVNTFQPSIDESKDTIEYPNSIADLLINPYEFGLASALPKFHSSFKKHSVLG